MRNGITLGVHEVGEITDSGREPLKSARERLGRSDRAFDRILKRHAP